MQRDAEDVMTMREYLDIVARERNEICDDLVYEEISGPYVYVQRTPLPDVSWVKTSKED